MRKTSILFLSMLFLILADAKAQDTAPMYTTIIKGGRVIDAKNNINENGDDSRFSSSNNSFCARLLYTALR